MFLEKPLGLEHPPTQRTRWSIPSVYLHVSTEVVHSSEARSTNVTPVMFGGSL